VGGELICSINSLYSEDRNLKRSKLDLSIVWLTFADSPHEDAGLAMTLTFAYFAPEDAKLPTV